MKKLLLTHSDPVQKDILSITEPFMQSFAQRHGYHFQASEQEFPGFSPHWNKVFLLQQSLQNYDQVLWLDNDVLITNPDSDFPHIGEHFQALALEQDWRGIVQGPNTGVWLLRKTPETFLFLEKILAIGQISDAQLHDQATISSILGFGYNDNQTNKIKNCRHFDQDFFLQTYWLGEMWNTLPIFHNHGFATARFLHFGGMPTSRKIDMLKYTILNKQLENWQSHL